MFNIPTKICSRWFIGAHGNNIIDRVVQFWLGINKTRLWSLPNVKQPLPIKVQSAFSRTFYAIFGGKTSVNGCNLCYYVKTTY